MSGLKETISNGDLWRAFIALYAIPALFGIVLGLGLASWGYLAFGGSIWTVCLVASVSTAVFVLLTEEMMYQ